jgi:Transcriptional regulatory protein, C terminal
MSLSFGDYESPVHVEPQVFDLLVYLVQNRDRVVSKDDLIASVWGGRSVSDSTLTSRINSQLVDDWLPKTTAVKPNSKCSTSSNCYWGCLNHESAASGVAPSDHGWRKNAFPVTWVTPAPGWRFGTNCSVEQNSAAYVGADDAAGG